MKRFSPPELRKDFVIIADREKPALCAAALSFLFDEGKYLPIFNFGRIEVSSVEPVSDPDVYVVQRQRAEHFAVFVNNALIQNGGCENLILLGLTEIQRSYLKFLANYNLFIIDTHEELQNYLGGFAQQKGEPLGCAEQQVPEGLCVALRQNRTLRICSQNQVLPSLPDLPNEGVMIIESADTTETIIAVNYACSCHAQVFLVDGMSKDEDQEILGLLEEWDEGSSNALAAVLEKINSRIANLAIEQFSYATCFTEGLPYSLVIDSIPVSLVNIDWRPDFFIHRALLYEYGKKVGSAVVFSPTFFRDEETDKLVSLLEFKNYYLRILTGKQASAYNLKTTVEDYPFDLLHICSHGGDVEGSRCVVKFNDSVGKKHSIEFDHVLSIALTPFRDQHAVESLYYFKKLDGLNWKSTELHSLGFPRELYGSLTPQISAAFDQHRVIHKGKVPRVANTNAISCCDFPYPAIFSQIGSSRWPPIIFNNSCWSWMTVSTNFLVSGARGYIGTLRPVTNEAAVIFAETFYDHVFEENVIDAVHAAAETIKEVGLQNLHLFWGLHFSTLYNDDPAGMNQRKVIQYLKEGCMIWSGKLRNGKGAPELVKGKLLNTQWMLETVLLSGENGHEPIVPR